jgi:hypothetical protein
MKLRLAFTAVLVPLLLVATVQADQPYPVYVTPVPAVAPTATAYSGPVTVVQRPAMPAYTHPSAPVVYQPATVLPVPTTVYRPAVGVAPVPVTVYRPGVSAAPVPITVYRPAAVAVPARPGCSGGRLLLAVDRLGGAGTRTARAQLLSSDHSLTSPFEKG